MLRNTSLSELPFMMTTRCIRLIPASSPRNM
jgi:hypothetical protein